MRYRSPIVRKLLILLITSISILFFLYSPAKALTTQNLKQKELSLQKIAPHLNKKALHYALLAYSHARQQGLDKKQIFSVIDFQDPSTEKRLWVFNMKNNKLIFRGLVAHGSHTGGNYAKHFSNVSGSRESSLGLYKAGKAYYGNDGYSMHLIGLTPGFNTNAYRRNVVMHGASYVSESFAHRVGRLGRSFGCTALNKRYSRKVINTVKDGTLIFAYYPDARLLHSSPFLQA